MFDIASVGNGLVGPGREMNESGPIRQADLVPDRAGRGDLPRSGETAARGIDRVELSEHAGLMSRLGQMPEVRWDRIEVAQGALQDDSYLDRHLEAAIDRLLDDLVH